jgi:hypothetical protein
MKTKKKEVNQLSWNGVWHVRPASEGVKLIKTIMVFTKKFDADGNMIKWKARCVAQGFCQELGHDYEETYSSTPHKAVVDLSLVRNKLVQLLLNTSGRCPI